MEQFSKRHSLNANDEFMVRKKDVDAPFAKVPLFHVCIEEGLLANFFVNIVAKRCGRSTAAVIPEISSHTPP